MTQTKHPAVQSAQTQVQERPPWTTTSPCRVSPCPAVQITLAQGSMRGAECKGSVNSILECTSLLLRIPIPRLLVPHRFFLRDWPTGSRAGPGSRLHLVKLWLVFCSSQKQRVIPCSAHFEIFRPTGQWPFPKQATNTSCLKCYRSEPNQCSSFPFVLSNKMESFWCIGNHILRNVG